MSAQRRAEMSGGDAGPRASAALVLAIGMLVIALPRAEAPVPVCGNPAAANAATGQTVAVLCDGAASTHPLRGPARLLFGLKIDPNVADVATLEVLPGIGPARARAIVEERARQPFASIDDLMRVRGIGPATVAGLAAHAMVGGGA